MGHPGWDLISRTAARLFLEKGFVAVSLREIATELGIKPASLYHHCPGGKAELFARSIQDEMAAYRSRLELAAGDLAFEDALVAVTDAMVAGGAIDFRRIANVDLPAVLEAGHDTTIVLGALHAGAHDPLRDVFARGQSESAVDADVDVDLAAATVLAIVAGLGWAHDEGAVLVRRALKLLLDGARK